MYKLLFKGTSVIPWKYSEAVSCFRGFNFHTGLFEVLPFRLEKCLKVFLESAYSLPWVFRLGI